MAFLFVNKDLNSPSLSRNTGSEAALASKVNKHVQQQRFRKGVNRKSQSHRVSTSNSTDSSTPSSNANSACGEDLDYRNSPVLEFSYSNNGSPRLSTSPSKSRFNSPVRRRAPRSVPEDMTATATKVKDEQKPEYETLDNIPDPRHIIANRPGDAADPFSLTVTPITPSLREVITRHLQWAVSSSVSSFTIHEGVRRIMSAVMTDHMHSAAFLAMATAQQRRTSLAQHHTSLLLPRNHSPEFYTYEATRLIREHIRDKQDAADPYVYVDVFRLAMTEWMNGNHAAARVHFNYIAQIWNGYSKLQGDWSDQHNLEVMSSEDIFLAVDIDERPLLDLTWEPARTCGPPKPCTDQAMELKNENTRFHALSNSLVGTGFRRIKAEKVHRILQDCAANLRMITDYSTVEFGSATTGDLWTLKRSIHAIIHRLQSYLVDSTYAMDTVICRTAIILLLLASTTPARRIARTDVWTLALRLRSAIINLVATAEAPMAKDDAADPGLWLWISMTGFVATQGTQSQENGLFQPETDELGNWFLKQSVRFAEKAFGQAATKQDLQASLMHYLYFEGIQGSAVQTLASILIRRSR